MGLVRNRIAILNKFFLGPYFDGSSPKSDFTTDRGFNPGTFQGVDIEKSILFRMFI